MRGDNNKPQATPTPPPQLLEKCFYSRQILREMFSQCNSALRQITYAGKTLKDHDNRGIVIGVQCCCCHDDNSIVIVLRGLSSSRIKHKSKYRSNSISNFSEKKIKFLGSHVIVLGRPFRWRINYLCRTDIDEARAISFLGIRKLGIRSNGQNSISNFFKKIHIFLFPWCSNREDHSIDVSITNVGLILTKQGWFQLFVESQNSNFELFWKKKSIFLVSIV